MEHVSNHSNVQLIRLDEVIVGKRHREDLGDVTSLANSIDDLGLLQPIVITPALELISGQRRMHAVRSLGHDAIEAYVVHGLDEASARLRAERDENTCRKALVPTEEHALYEALLDLERPRAQERKAQAPGQPQGAKVSSGKFPVQTARARNQASVGVSGIPGRYKTLDKVGEIKQVARASETPEPVRKVAEQVLREMDHTGRVDGGYQRVKDAERAAAAPQPSKAVDDFVNDSKSVQDANYIHEFIKAFARCGDWLRYDPDRISTLLSESEFDLLHHHMASAERFVKAVTSARRGLRLISGGEGK